MSVAIDDAKHTWYDHTAQNGGSVIDLAMIIEGFGNALEAIRALGDRYKVEPIKESRKPKKLTRGEMLVADGYALAKTYIYANDDGSPRYFVDRYERTDAQGIKHKEFVQRTQDAENLNGIERTIYNAQNVIKASRVLITEGEKDADTLNALGFIATTNSGGAKNWNASLSRYFADKDVVVICDNDEAGQAHGKVVCAALQAVAKSVKTLTPSALPKGDITDWFEREGGTIDALNAMLDHADESEECSTEVALAKVANQLPLTNYTLIQDGKKTTKIARRIDEICDDISARFLGFPKVIGSELFDFTRGKDKRILYLTDDYQLKAWINGTSKHQCDFQTGGQFASFKEIMARLQQTRKRYDGISKSPWYPARDDVFVTHGELPPPSHNHEVFNALIDRFLPATDADKNLIRAIMMAPMFATEASRPAWVIDTVDAQSSGKTSVIKVCARIYDEIPFNVRLANLDDNFDREKKRFLSADGRTHRIVLFDNLTCSFKSPQLAELITSQYITGMRPYGRGEESRRNDITWCATMNGASVDTDMATRSYVIHIRAPKDGLSNKWEDEVYAYVDANRAQIQADIIDLLSHAPSRYRRKSRFAHFDSIVLSAACATDEEFRAVDECLNEASKAANDDGDLAAQCVEAINNELASYDEETTGISPTMPVIIKCSDVDNILRRTNGGVRNWTSKTVRKFVNMGHIPNIVKGVERIRSGVVIRSIGEVRVFIYAANPKLIKSSMAVQILSAEHGILKRISTDYITI